MKESGEDNAKRTATFVLTGAGLGFAVASLLVLMAPILGPEEGSFVARIAADMNAAVAVVIMCSVLVAIYGGLIGIGTAVYTRAIAFFKLFALVGAAGLVYLMAHPVPRGDLVLGMFLMMAAIALAESHDA
jgi:hypothetical protein